MVLEVAVITIRPGQEDQFEAAYAGARTELTGTAGYRGHRLTRGVESPGRYVLLVEWDSVDAHVRNFRETERFANWRTAIGPYFAAPPEVEHYTEV